MIGAHCDFANLTIHFATMSFLHRQGLSGAGEPETDWPESLTVALKLIRQMQAENSRRVKFAGKVQRDLVFLTKE